MHQQIRTVPATSPPDVELLLRRLAEAGVNLAGAGGSNVEFGGEFAFAVDDGHEARAVAVLKEHKYRYRVFENGRDPELTVCWIKDNKPGQLDKCVAGVAAANLKSGRIIRDILIGVPDKVQGIPIQVFSEEVRTPQTVAARPGASKG
jgi:hypothetical protein